MRDQRAHVDGKSPITILELFRQFWEMDRYPVLGKEDYRVSICLEKEAVANIPNVVISSDDPPEFITWLTVLKTYLVSPGQYDSFIPMLYDFFDSEKGHESWV